MISGMTSSTRGKSLSRWLGWMGVGGASPAPPSPRTSGPSDAHVRFSDEAQGENLADQAQEAAPKAEGENLADQVQEAAHGEEEKEKEVERGLW